MGGKGGGLLQQLVIRPFVGLVIFFTCCYFVLGPNATASFARTTTSALGYAAGVTLGSLPNLFDNMKEGQGDADGAGSSQAAPAPRQQSQPRAATPERESRNATGNQRNDGTD